MNRIFTIAMTIALTLTLTPFAWSSSCCPPVGAGTAQAQNQPSTAAPAEPVEMPATGKKIALPGDMHFTWEFDQKPAMGTVVFKVRVFDKGGAQLNTLKLSGEVDMPSMRGHHSSGPVEFKLNKKGDYLLPVNIVMRGEWEVALTIMQGDQVVYRGFTRFRV